MGLGTRPTVWYFFDFCLFLMGLGTRPTVWYFFVFNLFLMALGILGQQCGISLFLVYFYWD
jgi:hypothetical protein